MSADQFKPVNVTVDAGAPSGKLARNWNFFGYDECNYTYTPEGQELLDKFRQMAPSTTALSTTALGTAAPGAGRTPSPYYVRTHHLLCTGNCHGFYKWGSTNVYTEGSDGQPVYNWSTLDLIFDTLLKHRCKPFVEIGFMPQDLVDPAAYDQAPGFVGWQMNALRYQQYGWSCPPKDYRKWHALVYHLVEHARERYGVDEIKTWYWELWNEPDIRYWAGTQAEFNKLYDYTAAAVKAACPEARVGGPSVTNPSPERNSGQFLDAFLKHCQHGTNYVTGQTGTPLDFITFHVKGGGYSMDIKAGPGNPPSIKRMLADVKTGYEIIARYPGYADLECVLSEIDPDGWAAGGQYDNVNLNFRNTEYYASFVAASFDQVSRFARRNQWNLKLLTWAFMFVGERCFEGTRAFSTQGIDKAILNLYRIYEKLGPRQIELTSTGAQDPLEYADLWGRDQAPGISGLATVTDGQSVEIMLHSHHDDWALRGETEVQLTVVNLPFGSQDVVLSQYRIDACHSNAYPEWVRHGKPLYPTAEQKQAIQARAGLELLEPPRRIATLNGQVNLVLKLPVHSISLLVLAPASA